MKALLFIVMLISLGLSDSYKIMIQDVPTIGTVNVYNDSSLTYKHTDTNDITIATLDSFTVISKDGADNSSDETPMYVWVIPQFKLDVFVLPNPFEIIGGNVKEISPDIDNYFNISMHGIPNNGTAIIVRSDRPLDEFSSFGRVDIFDCVGTNLAKNIPMSFHKSSDGRSIGVGVWNGKNLNGRSVGSGMYVAYIEIHATAETAIDGDINTLKQTYNKVIGVRTK